jgi:tetratricopeptide (TPR) repeat protein
MDNQDIIQLLTTLGIGVEEEDMSGLFGSLAMGAYEEYMRLGSEADIDRAVKFARESIRIDYNSNPELLLGWLNNLGVMLHSRYELTGKMSDLEEAVTVTRQAVELTTPSHPDRATYLNSLGVIFQSRYERAGHISDLEEAITAARQAVELTPNDHPDRSSCLSNLGNNLGHRYERMGEMRDLEEAVKVTRQAVESAPDDHPDRAAWLSNLGNKLESRYKRTGEISDLEEAIITARQAVESTPNDHLDWAGYLNNLGTKLEIRYDRTGEMSDLEEAITAARQAIESISSDHPDRAGYLNNLGTKLGSRYERTGEMCDLEEAITAARQTAESTPNDHPNRVGYLNNLGNKLESRYNRTGKMSDLEEAITIARQAVDSTPPDHPDRAAYLNSLGGRLGSRYEWTGEMRDLEEAIMTVSQAIKLTPNHHPERAGRLSNFGTKLESRYNRTGEMSDLEEAIEAARQAVESTPDDHPDRAGRLSSLGSKLEIRYKRTGEMSDLEEAITTARQAVELTPNDHPTRANRLSNLGNKLESRYERTGEMSDLEEAIKSVRQAVESTPSDHPIQASYLNNLGTKLENQYERTGEMNDLEEAITVTRQSVESTPNNHLDKAGRLNNLGNKLRSRYRRTGEMNDLEEASQHLYDAWLCQNAIPFHRIRAAARCLKLLAAQGKIEIAIPLGQAVIDLLPAVNTKFLDRADQQFVMSTFTGIAADVCALFLAANRLTEALEYLERSRGVIISYIIDSRSDLSSLARQSPDLARRYEHLRDEFNRPADIFDKDTERARNHRRQAADKLDACLLEIRETAGNERFLLGQTTAEMQNCAIGGTIVLINITESRSDAILVSSADIKLLSLPRLLASDTQVWLSKNWTGREVCRNERPLRNKEYLKYLTWLWEVCVQPVLDELQNADNGADGLPRVWWIGTGLASSMPFHAAGMHSPGSTENAFHRVISSYTPSIKALEYAQRRAKATSSVVGSLLIATMPTTPGKASQPDSTKLRDLPGVTEERKMITDIAKGYIPVEQLDLPSVDQVVDKLSSCYIAHFACHGSTDHMDPSNSGLVLQKRGENDKPEQDWLTVHRVSELNLSRSHIAYLSACSTAENKAARLSDEVIHVVSGFQVAGFPHVVGCMWPSSDRVCVEVAGGFYKSLLRNETRWDGREIAMAVRDAVMKVREADMEMPLVWAQFVHFGA